MMTSDDRFHKASEYQNVVLGAYESLLMTSSDMLQLARDADWGALVAKESDYLVMVERIHRLDAQQPLDDIAAELKADLLEKILEQDLEVRRRLLERREELSQLMGTSRRRKALVRAYGNHENSRAPVMQLPPGDE